MAEVMVQIKFSNRLFPRIYRVEGDDFNTIKDTIKTSGAKFDGYTKRWTLTSKAALDQLKSTFNVAPADFRLGGQYFEEVRFVANRDEIIFVASDLKQAQEVLQALQAAYNKSDEALKEALSTM